LKDNWSPIEATIIGQKETRLEIIKTLVSYGADVNLFGSQQSALFVELRALMFNSELTEKEQVLTKEIIEFLLKSGASPVEKDGSTLLHYLSYAGSLDMINAFYPECRQFINAQNDHGQTPLMWAARGGNVSVVEILIESGADIYTPDLDGKTAYDYAVSRDKGGQGDGLREPY
jgi:ankyrin repeat protein